MPNAQTLKGSWNEISGKLRTRWGQLTDDELTQFNGNVDELVGLIQRKTGESQESIQNFLDQLAPPAESAMGAVSAQARQAADQARQYASQAAERLQGASRQMTDSLRGGYGQAQQMIQQRPGQSLATAFGVGLVAGVIVGLVLGGNRS